MELDEASLAIGRIERALSRIEKSLSQWPPQVQQPDRAGDAAAGEDQNALRAEVAAVIGELDNLIAQAARG